MAVLRRILFCFLGALLLLSFLPYRALATDDSNTMQLSTISSVDAQSVNAALESLSQGVDDTTFNQMKTQFENQLSSGNYTGAENILNQMKQYLGTSAGSSLPDSLKNLIQNVRVGPNGAYFDWGELLKSSNVQQKDLLSTLDNLSQSANDPSMSQFLKQFENEVSSGDNLGAHETLNQLKDYESSPAGNNLPAPLKDLLQGLSVGPEGPSFNFGESGNGSNVDPLTLKTALAELSKNVKDENFMQLLNQFQSQLSNGDNLGAYETLNRLKEYSSSQQGTLPASLNDLLKSIDVGSDGASVDWAGLRNLIGADNPTAQGLPRGLSAMDLSQAASSLETLSKLSQNGDPELSAVFKGESDQIGQFLIGLDNPTANVFSGIPSPVLPSAVHGLPSPQLPSVGGPSVASALGLGGGFQPSSLIILGVLGAVILAAIFLRKNPGLFGRQHTPRPKLLEKESLSGLDRSDPRQAIIYYFRKAVRGMERKGVLKFLFETHREFSSKCTSTPETGHVETVSGLYEKAMFSGREVTHADADEAGRAVTFIEQPRPSRG